ncbi:hypothetical protein GYMLUDRAFT_260044 [Collybiopsis luxurians FD-317 M1]|uniref:GST N-terminal domain-containing protein n=1 Tax=Collybiopsis luxurians FD-317 M1 TaxID=944289 RepID=A0A0D0C3S2_9AGAR|nr:hypothetical protein GYMLUDRAFT_260044 [Collybiopsis luxurians FD-317 M1]
MITFYDLDGKMKGAPWSTNAWKTRYSLNFKGLPYKTVWLEYADVEPTMKKIGAPPTTVKPDGSPRYTIPAIYDDSTGIAITDSALVAEYLDKIYPDTPVLIPRGTNALQSAFQELLYLKMTPLFSLCVPDISSRLVNSGNAEYFEKQVALDLGVPSLEVMRVSGQARKDRWMKVQEAFGGFHNMLKDGDTWIMGDKPSFVDFVLASIILSVRNLYGKESREYQDMMNWHGGRWNRMMKILDEKYSAVTT